MIKTIEEIKMDMPLLYEEVKKGNIWLYDCSGVSRELGEEHREKIKEIEEKSGRFNRKVFAVIDSNVVFPDGERCNMVSYLYEDYYKQEKEYNGFFKYENGMYYVPAYVVNKTWDIEESGDIVIREVVGLVKRVY